MSDAAGEPRHKVIITGTGRSGTTFLVQVLGRLGLDTGFAPDAPIYEECSAGLERSLDDPRDAYIVKDPRLCEELEAALASGRYVIDHAFVPVRRLDDAAASRIDVSARVGRRRGLLGKPRAVPGGMWETDRAEEQGAILARKLATLIYTLVAWEVPHTFMEFPRIANDPEYLYAKLAPVLGGVDLATFRRAFDAVSRPELIHRYGDSAGEAGASRAT